MKKYYALFWTNKDKYVIRFQIDWDPLLDEEDGCFRDSEWYDRTTEEIIAYLVFGAIPSNLRNGFRAVRISHEAFKNERANGTRRWPNSIMKW